MSKDLSNDPWTKLRSLTQARIGLARSGASLATAPSLEFALAHARARDAVHATLDTASLRDALAGHGLDVLLADSAARDRAEHLLRPDLGRRLNTESAAALSKHSGDFDLAVVIADGLAARAAQLHAAPLLATALPSLRNDGWKLAPLIILRQARVAAGDQIAARLGARAVAVLIGERPGLSAPDSLGAYLTWHPAEATTDADRNCISNIRPGGISPDEAAFKIVHLLRAMRSAGRSGVMLKDETDRLQLSGPS